MLEARDLYCLPDRRGRARLKYQDLLSRRHHLRGIRLTVVMAKEKKAPRLSIANCLLK